MPTVKQTLIVTGASVALIILFFALRMPAPEVNTTVVSVGPLSSYIEEEGRTRLVNTYNISTPIQGFLQRVTLQVGDAVDAGDILFVLEPTPPPALDPRTREQARQTYAAAEARLSALTAQLEQAESELALQQRESARVERLADQGLVSLTELERAAANANRAASQARMATASLESARHEAEAARILVEMAEGTRDADTHYQLPIRAPISGVVLRLERCCEGVVMQGQSILELGNLDELEVQVDLLSSDAVRVKPGMRVEFSRWGGDDLLEGRVRHVDPVGFTRYSALGVEEQRVRVFISFTSEQERWQQLGEGYRVEAKIQLWHSDSALQIPVSALVREHNRWHVFVVERGRTDLRPVGIGQRGGMQQQILSGLKQGERVVTHPPPNLKANQRVRLNGG